MGANAATASTRRSASFVSTSRGTAAMSTISINMTALPSMTGMAARTPTSPSPSTAVPLVTTATVSPTEV